METKICLGCMQEIPSNQSRCPKCGFSAADSRPSSALPLKTVIHSRYVIGQAIRSGNDGLTYIAYDLQHKKPCIMREYFPVDMVSRDLKGIQVQIKPDHLAHYKALLSDFQDLYTQMMGWTELTHVRKVYDLFTENNTGYVAFEYLDAISLTRYLHEHGGSLSWQNAKNLFEPLFSELAIIHRNGYLHRAICPENLMVTTDGQLVLISFTISSTNATEQELNAVLSEGYAAPEQYSGAQHGEWTDIYGLSAVLYFVLTGKNPTHTLSRKAAESLLPPNRINPLIPKGVSDAIMMGMRYDITERIQNCTALRDALIYGVAKSTSQYTSPIEAAARSKVSQDTAMTAMFESANTSSLGKHTQQVPVQQNYINDMDDEDDVEYYRAKKEHKNSKSKKKRPAWVRILLWSIPIIILVTLLLYQLMIGFGDDKDRNTSAVSEESTVSQLESTVESEVVSEVVSSITKYPMVNFVGMEYDKITQNHYEAFVFENPQFEYNDSYEEGIVFRQSIDAGTQVEEGTKITLYVSSGVRSVTIPPTNDYTADQYGDLLLNKYGIPSTIEKEYSDIVDPGKIIDVSPTIGSVYDKESSTVVIIYQSIGSDPTIQADTSEEG